MATRTKADRSAAAKKGAATRKRNQAAAQQHEVGSRPSRPAKRSSTPPRRPGRPRRPRSARWPNGPTPRPRRASRPPSARRGVSRRPDHDVSQASAASRRLAHNGPAALALRAGDRVLELRLVHLRAALDAELLGLVVELVAGSSLGPARAGAQAAAAARRDVLGRGARARRATRRTRARSLLTVRAAISSARLLRAALLLQRGLDVLVLAGPLASWLHSTGGIRAPV